MSKIIWSDPFIERIVQLVSARAGLFFRDSQRDTVELGIRNAMRQAPPMSLAEYSRRIERDARAFDDLMIELTVGETYFFRDSGQMEFIRSCIVPEICGRREMSHDIRVWSAGCASGEEPYSLAILFSEAGLGERARILGTDISRRSLDRAQKGTYREWSLRGDAANVALKYLQRDGSQYQVDPMIRSRVQFEYLNLALDLYPSSVTGTRDLDLILCRNVLIYFDRETIELVARRFLDALTPGGWLMTAAGDPSLECMAPFETLVTTHGMFYRKSSTAKPPEASFFSPTRYPVWPELVEKPANITPPDAFMLASLPDVAPTVASSALLSGQESLASAQQALDLGEYKQAAAIAAKFPDLSDAAAVRIQALANFDLSQALQVCVTATKRHPLSAQLQYLQAVLLLELNREKEAAEAARRAVYLDGTLAIAHFTLGSIQRRLGDVEGARRSFRNARDICTACTFDELVRYSDGEHAGTLAGAAQQQLEGLNR